MQRRIAGHKSREIERILGYRGRAEMIHRDDLVRLGRGARTVSMAEAAQKPRDRTRDRTGHRPPRWPRSGPRRAWRRRRWRQARPRRDAVHSRPRQRRSGSDEAAILEANARDMAAAQASGLSGALLDRLAPRSRPGRGDGRRSRAGGRSRRPARPPSGRVGAAQWASHPPGLGADRRHRDHLRIAAQRDRRRRRALPDGG